MTGDLAWELCKEALKMFGAALAQTTSSEDAYQIRAYIALVYRLLSQPAEARANLTQVRKGSRKLAKIAAHWQKI